MTTLVVNEKHCNPYVIVYFLNLNFGYILCMASILTLYFTVTPWIWQEYVFTYIKKPTLKKNTYCSFSLFLVSRNKEPSNKCNKIFCTCRLRGCGYQTRHRWILIILVKRLWLNSLLTYINEQRLGNKKSKGKTT